MTTTKTGRTRIAGALAAAVLLSPFALTGIALAEDASSAPSPSASSEPAAEDTAAADEAATEEAAQDDKAADETAAGGDATTTSADTATTEQSVTSTEQAPAEAVVTAGAAEMTTQANGNGANDPCPGHNYCPTTPGPDNQGNGNAPIDGSVGNADAKNPPGQFPDGSDSNSGYECEPKHTGVQNGNPAHTACTVIPVDGNGVAALALAALSVPALGLALYVARRRGSSELAA